jgi:ketosteroid isomerase-like protein
MDWSDGVDMRDSHNTEIARQFFELIYAGDYDRAFSDCAHSDYRFVVGSSGNASLQAAIPWAGYTHEGREGYIALMNMIFSEFEPLSFETRRYSDTGDTVFVEGHFSFRHRATGKIADSDWVVRFDMKNGRMAGGQFYENTYAIAAART